MKMEALRREVTEGPKLFGNVLGILVAIALITSGLMIAYDWIVPVVVVRDQTLVKPLVSRREQLCADFVIDRYRNCPAAVYQYIFDGAGAQIPQVPLSVPARPLTLGTPDRIRLCVTVPDNATPGYARYQLSFTHTCEVLDGLWISKHTTAMPYLRFTILEPEEEKAQRRRMCEETK